MYSVMIQNDSTNTKWKTKRPQKSSVISWTTAATLNTIQGFSDVRKIKSAFLTLPHKMEKQTMELLATVKPLQKSQKSAAGFFSLAWSIRHVFYIPKNLHNGPSFCLKIQATVSNSCLVVQAKNLSVRRDGENTMQQETPPPSSIRDFEMSLDRLVQTSPVICTNVKAIKFSNSFT